MSYLKKLKSFKRASKVFRRYVAEVLTDDSKMSLDLGSIRVNVVYNSLATGKIKDNISRKHVIRCLFALVRFPLHDTCIQGSYLETSSNSHMQPYGCKEERRCSCTHSNKSCIPFAPSVLEYLKYHQQRYKYYLT